MTPNAALHTLCNQQPSIQSFVKHDATKSLSLVGMKVAQLHILMMSVMFKMKEEDTASRLISVTRVSNGKGSLPGMVAPPCPVEK